MGTTIMTVILARSLSWTKARVCVVAYTMSFPCPTKPRHWHHVNLMIKQNHLTDTNSGLLYSSDVLRMSRRSSDACLSRTHHTDVRLLQRQRRARIAEGHPGHGVEKSRSGTCLAGLGRRCGQEGSLPAAGAATDNSQRRGTNRSNGGAATTTTWEFQMQPPAGKKCPLTGGEYGCVQPIQREVVRDPSIMTTARVQR